VSPLRPAQAIGEIPEGAQKGVDHRRPARWVAQGSAEGSHVTGAHGLQGRLLGMGDDPPLLLEPPGAVGHRQQLVAGM
jgi:hypothetical protein